jgi:hypothetical protein
VWEAGTGNESIFAEHGFESKKRVAFDQPRRTLTHFTDK